MVCGFLSGFIRADKTGSGEPSLDAFHYRPRKLGRKPSIMTLSVEIN